MKNATLELHGVDSVHVTGTYELSFDSFTRSIVIKFEDGAEMTINLYAVEQSEKLGVKI